MNADTKLRGRLGKMTFRNNLDGMRNKGIVEERVLAGYVCDECNVKDPVGYRIIDDYKMEGSANLTITIVVAGIIVVLGIVLTPVLIGIPLVIGGLVVIAYQIIKNLIGKGAQVIIHEGEMACAACYGSPVSIDSTRGRALLKRLRSPE